jgi:hypothetical protein
MRSIYLVRVNHKYQVNPADCYCTHFGVSEIECAEFCQMLRTAIELHNIKGIAEEMNSEGLIRLLGIDQARALRQLPENQDLPEPTERDSVGFKLAKDLRLSHRYCDPDIAARKARNFNLPNVNYAVKSSFVLSFLESAPELSARLKEPRTAERKFEDVVKDAQQAAVLVLVY